MELFSQSFWVLVFVLATAMVALYFIGRQAILDALDEHAKREREREEREGRGSTRR